MFMFLIFWILFHNIVDSGGWSWQHWAIDSRIVLSMLVSGLPIGAWIWARHSAAGLPCKNDLELGSMGLIKLWQLMSRRQDQNHSYFWQSFDQVFKRHKKGGKDLQVPEFEVDVSEWHVKMGNYMSTLTCIQFCYRLHHPGRTFSKLKDKSDKFG